MISDSAQYVYLRLRIKKKQDKMKKKESRKINTETVRMRGILLLSGRRVGEKWDSDQNIVPDYFLTKKFVYMYIYTAETFKVGYVVKVLYVGGGLYLWGKGLLADITENNHRLLTLQQGHKNTGSNGEGSILPIHLLINLLMRR